MESEVHSISENGFQVSTSSGNFLTDLAVRDANEEQSRAQRRVSPAANPDATPTNWIDPATANAQWETQQLQSQISAVQSEAEQARFQAQQAQDAARRAADDARYEAMKSRTW